MSNNITIELCVEDRARIDRLIAALERRSCDSCVATDLQGVQNIAEEMNKTKAPQTDDVQQALAETLKKAEEASASQSPKNSVQEEEAPALPTTPPEEEKPEGEKPTQTDEAKKVSRADVRAKFVELSGKGKKEEAKTIIQAYAPKVPDLPEDKLAEILDKLNKLEG